VGKWSKEPLQKFDGLADISRRPWDRTPDESDEAFAAFIEYRKQDQHDRSLRDLSETIGKHLSLCGRWSKAHSWRTRVTMWDVEQDRIFQHAQAKGLKEMGERHARMATLFQSKILERLRGLQVEELTPEALGRWFEASAKIERLARGLDDPTKLNITMEVRSQMVQTVVHRLEIVMTEVGIPMEQRRQVALALLGQEGEAHQA
jgi:hypothetical protein